MKNFKLRYEIIVCDDASKDKTWELLQKNFSSNPQFKLLRNKRNKGITKNIYDLYQMAGQDYVLFYSADGDWLPSDIKSIIEVAVDNSANIVIGKRTAKIGYTFYRKMISYFHHLIPLILFGVETYDPGGIKLLKTGLVKIPLLSKSQFFEAEILIRAKKNGNKIYFTPVSYKKPHSRAGLGGSFKSSLSSVFDAFKLRLSI